MRWIKVMVALAVLVGMTATANAGDDLKIGTAGAQELRIPVGSRGTAMGGSVAASATGLDALYWNPAGAATIEGTDLMFSRRQYIADIDVDFVAAARNIEGIGVLAVSARILSMDDIPVTTVQAGGPDGTFFASSFSVVGLSYARTMTDRVSLGVNGNVVYEKLADQTATGFALDVGFTYTPGWNDLTFGAVVKNLGPKMRFDGPGFDIDAETNPDPNSLDHLTRTRSNSFEIPSHFQLGAAWRLVNQQNSSFDVTGTFQSNNFAQDVYRVGGEYALNQKLYLRGGYAHSDQTDYVFGASFGAGLVFAVGDADVNFDYAWSQSEFFDDNQYFTFQVSF